MDRVIGLDSGTTATKAVAVTADATVVANSVSTTARNLRIFPGPKPALTSVFRPASDPRMAGRS
jgi:activator of 2-hydroxyglutaryl-CoA dehydratase